MPIVSKSGFAGLFLLSSWAILFCGQVGQAFVVSPSLIQIKPTRLSCTEASSSRLVALDMAKRKGYLGEIMEDGGSVSKTRTVPKKRSKRKQTKTGGAATGASTKKTKEDAAAAISPLLQEWISKSDTDDDDDDSSEAFDESASSSIGNTKQKGSKNSMKKAEKDEQEEMVMELVQQLEDVLETATENKKSADIQDILNPIRQLLEMPQANGNLRQLIAGNKRLDYRLAWVGSDEAICHLGTGLHKVPLARLQEVFLSCMGKSRLEVYEVIRIIGPFPNVRNTLEGSAKIGKRNVVYGSQEDKTVTELKVVYDSMIDGTGKQITAGVVDDVRKVNLHIAFCDENAIVAVVPPDDDSVRADPLGDNGAHILFFAREDVLDEKLDALRVL